MSALLLDTHTFIWFSENAPNLSVALKEQIESADRVYLSIASLWEIAIKISIGKLTLQSDYAAKLSYLLLASCYCQFHLRILYGFATYHSIIAIHSIAF